MKCPLFRIAAVIKPGVYAKGAFDCLKEECGQWDKDKDCCSEVSKARAEWALVDVLTKIKDKMPNESQFRELSFRK